MYLTLLGIIFLKLINFNLFYCKKFPINWTNTVFSHKEETNSYIFGFPKMGTNLKFKNFFIIDNFVKQGLKF